jgi:hypothetical protein
VKRCKEDQTMNRTALVASAAVVALTASCMTAQPDPGDGYLCCNMRTDGKWISDANYLESGKTMIPFGTPVRFNSYGSYRLNVEVNGKRQSIGNDYSRDLAMDVFARRYIVQEDPRPKAAAAPEKIRRAIESARVTPGMTREQVIVAVGHPMSSENPHLDAPLWKYWLWSFSRFDVHFDGEGRVVKVASDDETLKIVYLP